MEYSQNQFFESNIFSAAKRFKLQISDKFEKTELKHPLCSFQNGRSHAFQGASSERRFLCKLGLKDAYFPVALNKIFRKYAKFLGNPLQTSLPELWPGACFENFHKTNNIPISFMRR